MTLAADYIDRLACPKCGAPVRRMGRWYISQGSWMFESHKVSAKRTHKVRPEYDGERWTNIPRTVEIEKNGITTAQKQDEWHYLLTHECTAGLHDNAECGAMWQEGDCRRYAGEVHWWMEAPEPPHQDIGRARAVVDATRGKMAAANDRGSA
jgi:hypothetical protein